MTLNPESEQQISKDIVRTFPTNPYFQKDNSGYYSMFKVLSAYSNLDEMMVEHNQRKGLKGSDSESCNSTSTHIGDSPRIMDRKAYRKNRNRLLCSDLTDSFCGLSFEDSTQYVQGMNFIVGILCYHLSPELAFCLFVKLMKDYDLEDNYTPGLKGFKDKSDKLNTHIKKHLPQLHEFFVSSQVFNKDIGEENDLH